MNKEIMNKEAHNNPIIIIPILMFITNIGNGMYTLAVGYLMYKVTGSTSAFAGILVFENVFSIFVQLFASVVVDDGKSKQCAVFSDFFRGIFVLLAGILVSDKNPYVIYLGVIAINLVRPFYRTAMFAIGPLIAEGENLAKYSARNSVAQQVGQLIGAGIAGFIISSFGANLCIIINGISFIISASLMCLVRIPSRNSTIENSTHRSLLNLANPIVVTKEWVDLFKHMFKEHKILCLIIFCTIDYLVISFINMAYAPMIKNIECSDTWMSIWDCLFAVGAILGAMVFSKFRFLRDSEKKYSSFMLLEGLFLLLFGLKNTNVIALSMLGLGITNAFSVSCFSYELQTKAKGKFHGRIAGLKQFVLSIVSMIVIPFFSKGFNKNMISAVCMISLLCLFGFLGVFFLVSRLVVNDERKNEHNVA